LDDNVDKGAGDGSLKFYPLKYVLTSRIDVNAQKKESELSKITLKYLPNIDFPNPDDSLDDSSEEEKKKEIPKEDIPSTKNPVEESKEELSV
jgi:hypothetical protein